MAKKWQDKLQAAAHDFAPDIQRLQQQPPSLLPQSSVKIVQPADAGIVKEILVSEGDEVSTGQVLARMGAQFSDADGRSLKSELHLKSMQLYRADAQLAGVPLQPNSDDPPELFTQVRAQYSAREKVYAGALGYGARPAQQNSARVAKRAGNRGQA